MALKLQSENDFYGYPVLKSDTEVNQYSTAKSEYMFVEVSYSVSLIEKYITSNAAFAGCSKKSLIYRCPYQGDKGEGNVSMTLTEVKKSLGKTGTSIRYKFEPSAAVAE